uniref:Putative secreted peptide n=1 Tax=Anopheles braziliensis TaxID=58242 RepID=A0A2M3ZWF1_9DIPT
MVRSVHFTFLRFFWFALITPHATTIDATVLGFCGRTNDDCRSGAREEWKRTAHSLKLGAAVKRNRGVRARNSCLTYHRPNPS